MSTGQMRFANRICQKARMPLGRQNQRILPFQICGWLPGLICGHMAQIKGAMGLSKPEKTLRLRKGKTAWKH